MKKTNADLLARITQPLNDIIFQSSHVADKVVEEELQTTFQKFRKTNIEKGKLMPVVPCFRCFSYGHIKKELP